MRLSGEEVVVVVVLGAVVVLAGLAVLVVEAHVSTGGVLGVAGVMAAAAGTGLVMMGSGIPLVVTIPVAVVLAVLGVGATLMVAREVLAARAREVRTGPSSLIGQTAKVRTWSQDEGQVLADGALWRARLAYGWEDPRPVPGQAVIVAELDGLTVSVRRPNAWEVTPIWRPSPLSL